MEPVINFIPVDIDPRNSETPVTGSVTFRITTDNPETDSVFYSLSINNSTPEDPLFHEYDQGRDITVVSDAAAIYYILIRAFDETGDKASLTVPLYFSEASSEPGSEPEEEEEIYDSEGALEIHVDVVKADENPAVLVENVVYTLKFTAVKGSGTVKLIDIPPYIILPDNIDIVTDGVTFDADHTEYGFNFMVSSCHNGFGFDLNMQLDDNTVTIHFSTATESELYPYKGNRILWKKVEDAKYYNIYRSEDVRNHMTLIIRVPADTYSKSDYQWYIDRQGTKNSAYAVAPVDVDGYEGELSYPRFSPDKIDNMCLVQGSIVNLGSKGISDIPIAYRIKEYPSNINNSFILKTTNLCYTDERGFFELLVPQNSIIMLMIDDVGFKRSLVIPPVKAANLDDLLNMPQNRIF